MIVVTSSSLLAILLVFAIVSPQWLATPVLSTRSPDAKYRLDFLRAFYLTTSDYGFVRLYDNSTGAFMCESDVEWLTGNGELFWPEHGKREVMVGASIRLEFNADGTKCSPRRPSPFFNSPIRIFGLDFHESNWFATPVLSQFSPDEKYRVDVLQAFTISGAPHAFARLFDARSGALMCQSAKEPWHRESVTWPSVPYNKVSVGPNIHLALSDDGTICVSRKHLEDPAPVPPPAPPPEPAVMPGRISVDRGEPAQQETPAP